MEQLLDQIETLLKNGTYNDNLSFLNHVNQIYSDVDEDNHNSIDSYLNNELKIVNTYINGDVKRIHQYDNADGHPYCYIYMNNYKIRIFNFDSKEIKYVKYNSIITIRKSNIFNCIQYGEYYPSDEINNSTYTYICDNFTKLVRINNYIRDIQNRYKNYPVRLFKQKIFCFLSIRWFRKSILDVFPKDIVKLIAKEIWNCRYNNCL
jgi:hypothetical protein